MKTYYRLLAQQFDIPELLLEVMCEFGDDDLALRCITHIKKPYMQELAIYSWINSTMLRMALAN